MQPGPWHSLQLDINNEFFAAPRQDCFVVVVLIDKYSKYREVDLMDVILTKKIIDFLESVWTWWGILMDITMNHGIQFHHEFNNNLVSKGIVHKYTPLHCPQINGNVEHFNYTLNGLATQLTEDWSFKNTTWEILATYCTTVCNVMGHSMGRHFCMNLSTLAPVPRTEGDMQSARKWTKSSRRPSGEVMSLVKRIHLSKWVTGYVSRYLNHECHTNLVSGTRLWCKSASDGTVQCC